MVEQRLLQILEQALPDTAEAELVDLLDFIQVQHSGSSLNPDNTSCADAIVNFVRQRPFAASQRGVEALARLARHAAGAAERREGAAGGAPPITPEHHLWLLTSSALNTAAAICASGGADPALTFARRRLMLMERVGLSGSDCPKKKDKKENQQHRRRFWRAQLDGASQGPRPSLASAGGNRRGGLSQGGFAVPPPLAQHRLRAGVPSPAHTA